MSFFEPFWYQPRAETLLEPEERLRREAAEKARREIEDREIRDLMHRDRIAALRLLVETIARRERITIHWIAPSDYARAAPGRRVVWIWPIQDERTAATALHDVAHVVNGKCPGKHPHRRMGDLGCIECEVAASAAVMRMIPLTRQQHVYLARCLQTYRSTPAPAEAVDRLEKFCRPLSWLEDRQKRLRWQIALERQRIVNQSLGRKGV